MPAETTARRTAKEPARFLEKVGFGVAGKRCWDRA